jgi:N-ethylmaleimide reductase
MLNEIPQPLLQPRRLGDLLLPAQIAKDAGFDGLQLQAGFVYLIQQFLHQPTNRRTDEHGGSIENRARFLFDVLEAVLEVWPSERVGVKTGPMMNELGLFKAVESTLHAETEGASLSLRSGLE